MLVVRLFMLSVIKCGMAVFGQWRAGRHLVAEVERGGGGEADLYDLRQEDTGGRARRRTPHDEPWTPVVTPAQGGWRFFKVGVEMR